MYMYRRLAREGLELEARKRDRESLVSWQGIVLRVACILESPFLKCERTKMVLVMGVSREIE